jgi:hypothetical protein
MQEDPMRHPHSDGSRSVLKLGAVASVVQSVLFVVIGLTGLGLGVDRLVDDGFASLVAANPAAFRALCIEFVLIAVLGVAITPAERSLVEPSNAGLAAFGSNLAFLGHAGTIAYFSWWLLRSLDDASRDTGGDALAPIEWGVMFELVLVGASVWIIAGVILGDPRWPRGFLALSVVKATAFWFTFLAFVVNEKWMIMVGLGATTFVAGPAWHLWIARVLRHRAGEDSR